MEHPAGLQHNPHIPAERAACPRECGAEVAGWGCGSSASQRAKTLRSLPAPVSAQLPNSGTLANLLWAGGPPRSGPHHRGREGGAVCARTPRRPGGPGRAARRFLLRHTALGSRSIRGRRGASGSPGLGTGGAGGDPPPAVAQPGSPAGEQRKCRGVGAGPAPWPLLLAELLPPGGRAGGLTLRAGGRAAGPAGPAGRGGADRPR